MTHPVRAAAAIVGVADEISPDGMLDGEDVIPGFVLSLRDVLR